MVETQEQIANSQKILYRYNKRSNWREGRLTEISNGAHQVYSFEKKAKVLDWDNHKNGIPSFKFTAGWFFFCWLPSKNIQFV